MNAFVMGKEAALSDLYEMVEAGAGVTDCLEAVNKTVNTELDKRASLEDVDYRLGVESACYDFLKEAADLYGNFDTSDVDDTDIAEYVLRKVAARNREDLARAQMSLGESAQSLGRHGTQVVKRNFGKAKEKAKEQYGKAKQNLWTNRTGLERLGIGAGLAATGYGAKKLKEKRDSEKRSSYNVTEEDVQEALEILEAAGYLDD